MGIERATFLFNKDLKLIKVWRNVKVKGHVEEVLNFVKNLDNLKLSIDFLKVYLNFHLEQHNI